MTIREQIDILAKLQKIDSEITRVNHMLGKVEGRLKALDMEFSEFELAIQKEQSDLDEVKKTYRGFESDVNTNLPKIEKSKERLSSVKTNKEYQSLLKEIDDLMAINSDLEDRMLECLEQIDLAEHRLKGKESELNELRDRIQAEKSTIAKERSDGNERLGVLNEEWQTVLDTVDSDVMKTFKKVRGQVGNLTIARVENEVCKGCNMNIPPQMYNELQRCEKLMFCPHCQRIIYTQNERSKF